MVWSACKFFTKLKVCKHIVKNNGLAFYRQSYWSYHFEGKYAGENQIASWCDVLWHITVDYRIPYD